MTTKDYVYRHVPFFHVHHESKLLKPGTVQVIFGYVGYQKCTNKINDEVSLWNRYAHTFQFRLYTSEFKCCVGLIGMEEASV